METRNKKDLLEESKRYFKERRVFEKVFRGFRDKYRSLGHMGGTVTLQNLTQEEKEQLGGFLGKDYFGKKQISVSCRAFEIALGRSRFFRYTLQEILEAYFDSPLIAQREEQRRRDQEKNRYFEGLCSLAENSSEAKWLRVCVEQKNQVFRYMEKAYKSSPETLLSVMKLVCQAGNRLPALAGEYELLPVFAARIAKNPHALDSGTMAHHLLISYLRYLFPEAAEEDASQTEQTWSLLYQGGILRDDLSNAVLVYGMHGIMPDGGVHAGLEGFLEHREPLYLTLLSLTGLRELCSADNRIYMVENPAVFSYLCGKYPQGSFICGNGQQRMAVWVLLSKIPEEQKVWYAGDFDPEGLGIAQRLRQRFPEKVRLWKYDVEYYERYLSSHAISETRLRKLDKVTLPELQELCDAMRSTGYAAYQEGMLGEYIIH